MLLQEHARVKDNSSIQRMRHETKPYQYYYETDTGLSFQVPKLGIRLIDLGQRYRLYYTVEGQVLVNLEPVGSTFSGTHQVA